MPGAVLFVCGTASLAAYALLAITSHTNAPHAVRMAIYAGIIPVD